MLFVLCHHCNEIVTQAFIQQSGHARFLNFQCPHSRYFFWSSFFYYFSNVNITFSGGAKKIIPKIKVVEVLWGIFFFFFFFFFLINMVF